MFEKLLNVLFGCWHNNLSFPLTVRSSSRRSAAASLTGTYVVCLDCGKEFAYNWHEMRIVNAKNSEAHAVRELAPKQAA